MLDQSRSRSKSPAAPRNVTTYSRSFLLSLYQSPLVPLKPEGMKELSEWFGDYDSPSFSPTRQHQQPPIVSVVSSANHVSVGEPRTARPNPFANFGRFGVDGGLEGTVATAAMGISTKGGESKRNRDSAPHLHGGAIEKEKPAGRERDWDTTRRGGAGTAPEKSGETSYLNERERPERTSRRGGDVTNGARDNQREPGVNGRERREEKKEGRAEEGGWRTAGDRDRRLRPNQSNSNSNSNSYSDPLRASASESRNTRSSKSNQPAWMDDDTPAPSGSSSTPAWMDSPASGDTTYTAGEATGEGAPLDDIQAWKQQMKEMERKERNQSNPSAPPGLESVPAESAHRVETQPEPAQVELIHRTLSNSSTAQNLKSESREQSAQSIAASHAPGGESRTKSRFAKYFDGGKPAPSVLPHMVPPPAPVASSFGGTATGGGTGASTEDRESMNRLMGMLQLSGARASTDSNMTQATAPSAPRPPSPPLEPRSRQASTGGSRFGFAQPAQAPAPPPTRQEALPSSQSQQFSQSNAQTYQSQPQYSHMPPTGPAHHQLPPPSQLPVEAGSRNGFVDRSRASSNGPLASPPLQHQQNQQAQQQQYSYGPDGRPYALPPPGMNRGPMDYSQGPPQQYAQQPLARSQSQQRQPQPNYPPQQSNYGPPPGMNRMPDPMMQQSARASLPNGFAYPQQQQQFPPSQYQRMPPPPSVNGYYQGGPPVDLMALLNSRPLPPRNPDSRYLME